MTSTVCPFCVEVASGQLESLGAAVAIRDRYPVTDGHLLIIPRRHVEELFELTDRELADVWHLLTSMRERLYISDSTIEGFNVGVNVGEVAGQTIPHAHVHLIPRRRGDTPDPRGGVRGVVPKQMAY